MENVIFYPISCIGNPGSRQNAVGKSTDPAPKAPTRHQKHQLPAFLPPPYPNHQPVKEAPAQLPPNADQAPTQLYSNAS